MICAVFQAAGQKAVDSDIPDILLSKTHIPSCPCFSTMTSSGPWAQDCFSLLIALEIIFSLKSTLVYSQESAGSVLIHLVVFR